MPASEVDRFMELALKARSQPVRTVSFVPPMINTGHPDIAKIQAVGAEGDQRSEGKVAKKKATQEVDADARRPGRPRHHRWLDRQPHAGYAANQATDLSSAC